MFHKRWEVYRVIPESWSDIRLGPDHQGKHDHPYWKCRTEKAAKRMAADCDWELRNGRSDEDFAAFKVRRNR